MTEDKTPEDTKPAEPEAAEPEAAKSGVTGESATQRVIGAFGGIRPMANKLGAAVSTVQGWKERDAIPPGRHPEIREAAANHGVTLSDEDLAASEGSDKEKVTTWVPRDEAAGDAAPDESAPVTIDMKPAGGAAPKAAPHKPEEKPEEKPESQRTKVPESGSRARAEDRKAPSAAAKPDKPAAPAPARQASESHGPESHGPESHGPESHGKVGWLIAFLGGAAVAVVGFGLAVLTVDIWSPGGGAADGAAVAGLQKGIDDLDTGLAGQAQALEKLAADLAALPAPSSDPAPEIMGQLNDLGATAADLTRRLDALEQRPAGSGPSSDQLEALSKTNLGLGTRLSTLEQDLAALGQPGPELATLEDRFTGIEGRLADLDRLEQELTALTVVPAGSDVGNGAAGGEMALVLALIQLRDALGGPGPYGAQLDQFSQVAGGQGGLDTLLAPLRARAASGVPTLAGLTVGFSQVAGAVVAAGAGTDADGVLSGVLQSLSDVVTVRPIGDIEGSGAGAVVARVEHRLRAGDLSAALRELDALDGAAAEAAASWRADAEARIAADTALAALGAALVTQLARSGG